MKLQHAIVVGASSGIGAAIAGELAGRGCRVALLARRVEELEARRAEIQQAHPDAPEPLVRTHDVVSDDVSAAFAETVEALGGLDLLVYAAGVMPEIGADQYDGGVDADIVSVNTIGAMRWLDEGARHLQPLGRGALVSIGSVAGDRGRRGNPAYCASKAALHTFSESLHNRLQVHGVRVLTIKPGFTDTPMTQGKEGLFWLNPPENVARRMIRALDSSAPAIYEPARWRLVMFVIRSIPSFLFRRMSI